MNNPLTTLFSKISFLSNRGGEHSAVGIDVGSSSIKVVEIKKKRGRAILETYGVISLGSYAETDAGKVTNLSVEKLNEALVEVLKQSGIMHFFGAFSIPVQSSLVFNLELPISADEKDLHTIISTEARKYIPVPINEVSLDYFILPKKESSFEELHQPEISPEEDTENAKKILDKTAILVVATQNDIISKFRSLVSLSKLSADFFEIEIFSSIRSNFEHELSPAILIDFGASKTKISIVEYGMLKNYHTIDRGGADISESISNSLSIPFSEAEKMKKEFGLFGNPLEKALSDIIKLHIDYIFSEVNSVLLSYEKKYNRTISKIILTGGGAMLKGLKESAVNNFQAEVQIGHPFSKVNAPAFLEKVLSATGPEFAVALGLALRKLQ